MSEFYCRFAGRTYQLGALHVPVVGEKSSTGEVLLSVAGQTVWVKADDLEPRSDARPQHRWSDAEVDALIERIADRIRVNTRQ